MLKNIDTIRVLAIVVLVALLTVAGVTLWSCTGSGRSSITVPTPVGPAVVDLWWCEADQCVAITDPAETPEGVDVLARGITLEEINGSTHR